MVGVQPNSENRRLRQGYERRLAQDIEALTKGGVDLRFPDNPFRSLTKRFVIASSARTGSHLLCERLLTHGAVVTECFLPGQILAACRKAGTASLAAYCERYLENNALGGVFGTKGLTRLLAPLILAGEFPEYRHDWRFVHLTREDILKQAISFVIADLTQSWRSFKAPARELGDEDFDAARIARTRATCELRNRQWNDTFELFGIEPMRITYEQLSSDPDGVAARVAEYLDLTGPPVTDKRFVNPPLEVQTTNVNARWEEMFLASAGGP